MCVFDMCPEYENGRFCTFPGSSLEAPGAAYHTRRPSDTSKSDPTKNYKK